MPESRNHPPGVAYRTSCGCVNIIDPHWGAIRCHSKCKFHTDELKKQPTGLAYYESISTIENGIPQCARYVQQMTEALGNFQLAPGGLIGHSTALEIGCGASMYAPALLQAGYRYHGVEPDAWAAEWTRSNFCVRVSCRKFPAALSYYDPVSLILCAHALEHMPDAPGALMEMHKLLPKGGPLYLLIPDDQDETNPDHTWFFNADNLRSTLTKVGFEVEKLVVRRYIDRESFLYCLAKKV